MQSLDKSSTHSAGPRRESRSYRVKRHQQEQAAARQKRIVGLAAAGIILVLAALVAGRLLMSSSSSTASADGPAPDSLVAQVTGVPTDTLEQVGRGTLSQLPLPAGGDVLKGADNKPLITYVGAEYCPFCAGERWPLIIALSRFGTFNGLAVSHSASDDVYPNTPTFSFANSSYSSPYIDLSTIELQSNARSGPGYQTLQTPTPAQNSLLTTYDSAPYVPASSAGSIPFIDFANQYLVSGAGYDVGVLRGMNQDQVAAALADPTSPQAKAILGTANALTAAICTATGNTPADVCGQPAVKALQTELAATPPPAR